MQKYVIALYIRLSLEDYKYDSMSIENQHLALNEFVSSMPESANAEVLEFIDNGYSGTNFERPKVQELIEVVRANKIDCIIVKDFSRFGRNSIETGYFIERVFPLFHTRFISINDDFDSDQHKGDTGGMDVAFKYLISEYYPHADREFPASIFVAKSTAHRLEPLPCGMSLMSRMSGRWIAFF